MAESSSTTEDPSSAGNPDNHGPNIKITIQSDTEEDHPTNSETDGHEESNSRTDSNHLSVQQLMRARSGRADHSTSQNNQSEVDSGYDSHRASQNVNSGTEQDDANGSAANDQNVQSTGAAAQASGSTALRSHEHGGLQQILAEIRELKEDEKQGFKKMSSEMKDLKGYLQNEIDKIWVAIHALRSHEHGEFQRILAEIRDMLNDGSRNLGKLKELVEKLSAAVDALEERVPYSDPSNPDDNDANFS